MSPSKDQLSRRQTARNCACTPATRPQANNVTRSARLPILDWVVGYRKEWVRLDVVAGVTAAAVVIPKAMAYATIAGLPVQAGLYTTIIPMALYAVLGTSRPLSVSTTTTIAVLMSTELAVAAPSGDPATILSAAAMLTLIVGGVLVLASLLR